jgi:hypothetical protein
LEFQRDHGFREIPNVAKPRGRVDNEKVADTHWHNFALQHAHQVEPIVGCKIRHAKAIHMEQDGNTIRTGLFIFHHRTKSIRNTIEHYLADGDWLGNDTTWSHITHFKSFTSSKKGNGKYRL